MTRADRVRVRVRVTRLSLLLQVIAPEEIVDPNVDEHSVMTYLSQFPKSKLKPGAPLRAKTLHPKRAKAFGPGEGKNSSVSLIWYQPGVVAYGK